MLVYSDLIQSEFQNCLVTLFLFGTDYILFVAALSHPHSNAQKPPSKHLIKFAKPAKEPKAEPSVIAVNEIRSICSLFTRHKIQINLHFQLPCAYSACTGSVHFFMTIHR